MHFRDNKCVSITLITLLIVTQLSACRTPLAPTQSSAPLATRPIMPEHELGSAAENFLPATPTWEPAVRYQHFLTRQLSQILDQRAPEISGLAASNRQDDLLWVINDSGNKPSLLAFSSSGEFQAEWQTTLKNRDWEDLASFTLAGHPYLLVAETGDNRELFPGYSLYIFDEPPAGSNSAEYSPPLEPVATIRFVYPDGPHNSEAVAVSQTDNTIIIVTKASDSAGIYSLPLSLDSTPGLITATRLGTLPTLPQAPGDGLIAKLTGIDFAVATALDINPQGNAAVLLTYREVYRWTRQTAGQSWNDVFAQPPQKLMRHDLQQAEAVSFDSDGISIYVTSERIPSPVLLLEPDTAQAIKN